MGKYINRRSLVAIGIFIVFYIVFGIFVTLYQERIVYQPSAQDFESCAGFARAEKVEFQGTRLYVQPGERGYVVLYHGNGGSACDRAFLADLIEASGYGYIVPEYTGYSNDSEKVTHDLIKKDVENVIGYLKSIDAADALVIGESIGSGLASYHTSLAPPPKLLLISPFSSLLDMAQHRFWFYPAGLLVDNAFDNVELLKEHRPGSVLIIHGEEDRTIPSELSKKLHDNLSVESKQYVLIPGVGHNDLFTAQETYESFQNFLSPGGKLKP